MNWKKRLWDEWLPEGYKHIQWLLFTIQLFSLQLTVNVIHKQRDEKWYSSQTDIPNRDIQNESTTDLAHKIEIINWKEKEIDISIDLSCPYSECMVITSKTHAVYRTANHDVLNLFYCTRLNYYRNRVSSIEMSLVCVFVLLQCHWTSRIIDADCDNRTCLK